MNRCIRAATLASALAGSVSCGALVALTGSRPADHRSRTAFQCFESRVGPKADVVVAGFGSVYWFGGQGKSIAIGRSFATTFAVSAALGFFSTKRCREAKVELAVRNALAARGMLAVTDTAGPPVPVVIEIEPETDTVVVGRTSQLRAVVRYASGAPVEGARISWTSRSRAIATVSKDGLVTAHVPGGVLVLAWNRGIVDSTLIVVVPP
jgi:hypothetical protein